MLRRRLVERDIQKLDAPPKGNRRYHDDALKGFSLRVTANGARSFALDYSINGRERRLTVGKWPEWNVTRARAQAKELRRQINAGIDPLAEKQQALKDPTFAQLVTEYLEVEASEKKSFREIKRALEADAVPALRNVRAVEIRRRDIAALLDRKSKTAPIQANRLRAYLSRLFEFALEREIVELNPCHGLKAPGGKEKSRERALDPTEIQVFWRALEGGWFTDQTASALRLMLATAQREGEVCSLRWDELDLSAGWWTLPHEKTKSERAHRAALNATALEVLNALPRVSPWVFPSPLEDEPIRPNAVALALRRARQRNEELGALERFSPHDLRRRIWARAAFPSSTLGSS